MPIIIFLTITILFLSFFLFPYVGYFIAMGYGNFDWARRDVNSLIMSGIFILLWAIVLFVAVKTKSRLLLGLYKYYWLTVIGACIIAVLFALFEIDALLAFSFLSFIFLVLPIYGMGSLLIMSGFASPRDDLTVFYLLVAVIIFVVGIFVKHKFGDMNNSTN